MLRPACHTELQLMAVVGRQEQSLKASNSNRQQDQYGQSEVERGDRYQRSLRRRLLPSLTGWRSLTFRELLSSTWRAKRRPVRQHVCRLVVVFQDGWKRKRVSGGNTFKSGGAFVAQTRAAVMVAVAMAALQKRLHHMSQAKGPSHLDHKTYNRRKHEGS